MGSGKRLSYYVDKQGFIKKKFCEKFSFDYNNMTSITDFQMWYWISKN
jgi:hypothetical protein